MLTNSIDASPSLIECIKRRIDSTTDESQTESLRKCIQEREEIKSCLLYTSPSPRDYGTSRMPSSA